jgi:VWFA-related protein
MIHPGRLLRVAGICAFAAAALSAQAPETQRFRSGVDLVTVDAVVVDRDGQPVVGLTRADFTVLEDGRRQAVTDFEAIALDAPVVNASALPPPAPLPPVSSNVGQRFAAASGRAFAVVFDDLNLTRAQGDQARKALKDFLEGTASPDDTITFVTTSGVAWLNAKMPADRERLLGVMSRVEGKFVPDTSAERMTDYEAMRIHQYQDILVEAQVRRRYEYNRVNGLAPRRPQDQNDNPKAGDEMRGDYGVIDSYIQSHAEEVYATHEARNREVLNLIARAVDALRSARGRKSVVLLSKGFIYDTELRGFRDVARAAREANVAIYFIDARGLEVAPSQFTAQSIGPTDPRDIGAAFAGIQLEAAGAVSVAEESGGFAVLNNNDLSSGFRRIAAESRQYYLLGYVSSNAKRDGRFRRIEVKVTRPGVKVRARRGYYAPQDAAPGAVTRVGLDPDVQRALDAPREIADVPLRATALVFEEARAGIASVMLAAETDVRRFAFKPAQGRLTNVLEFAAVVTNRETGEVAKFGQSVEMNLQPDTLRSLAKSWYPVAHEFELAPGPYEARIAVRDRNAGLVGSVTHAFEVPALAGFRVSSPILSDAVQAESAAQTAKPLLLARRTFDAGATLFCQFAVFGAARDAATGRPRVTSGWRLLRADGSLVREQPARELAPDAAGGLVRLYGISLAGLLPGEYALALEVRDEIGVEVVERREPFTVEPGVGISPVALISR